jgi:hypothetical protein
MTADACAFSGHFSVPSGKDNPFSSLMAAIICDFSLTRGLFFNLSYISPKVSGFWKNSIFSINRAAFSQGQNYSIFRLPLTPF